MKGFINLIKPQGMSSAYAVSQVKKKLKVTCGHMGTLDPMASGVLPIGIEKTSRMFDYLLDKEKTYVAEFVFGYTTDTLDATGVVTERTTATPTQSEIIKVLPNFVGEIEQMPPKYSAKCIDGKRGYQLARQGVEFELQPKKVTVLSIELDKQTGENKYQFTIRCKGGTYIRSLARDIAKAVNSLGVMTSLVRTQSGVFNLEKGVSVEEFINSTNPEKYLIAPDTAVNFPKAVLTNEQATKILNGVFEYLGYQDGLYRVYNQQEFWGIGVSNNGVLKIKAYVR